MARYPAGHKEETRQRIIETAATQFRCDGLDGAGVTALMQAAGLTNGAFYAHFASKDDLAAAAVASQVHHQAATFERAARLPDGLERVLTEYLCPQHRDNRATGCVSAALLSDLSRATPEIRRRYTEALPELCAGFRRVAALPADTSDATVLTRLAFLVGTLQLARAVDDAALSADILTQGRDTIRALLAADRGQTAGRPSDKPTRERTR